MWKQIKRVVVVLALIAPAVWAQEDSLRAVTIRQHAHSRYEGDAPLVTVIRDVDAWENAWSLQRTPGTPPPIDFEQEMVIAAFLGRRPTGGYRIEIVSVRELFGTLFIEVRARAPSSDDVVAQYETSPYHLVRTRRADLPASVRYRDSDLTSVYLPLTDEEALARLD